MDSIKIELVSNASSHLHSSFQTTRSFHIKFLAGASEFGRTMGDSNFRDFLPINVPKRYRAEIYVL